MGNYDSVKRLIAFVLLSFAFVTINAQTRTRIYGMVKDEAGKGIELATVRLQGTASMVMTNLKGQYNIYCNMGDSVTVVFSQLGHQTRKKTLIAFGDSMRVDVVLPPYNQTDETAVVKGMGIQSGSMVRLNTKNNDFAPSASGNAVEELVATQAGVSTHNELSSQYNVRGGSFDENCVYLNGVEVYRPMLVRSGEQEGLSIINSDMVDKISFSTGGFEARYGDKMSSVLDITYKRPEKFEAKLNGSILGGSAYIGWGNKHFSFMSSVRYKTTKYLLGSTDTEGEDDPKFLDYQAYLSWRPSKRWTIDVIGNISDNEYNFIPKNRVTNFGTIDNPRTFVVYFDGQEKDYFKTYFGSATVTHNFNPNTYLALNFSTFKSKEAETYDIQGEYWLNEATSQEELGVGTYMEHARNRLRANVMNTGLKFRTRLTGHTIQSGFDWQHEDIKENSREWEMRDSMGYSLPYDPNQLRLIYSLAAQQELKTNRLSFYLQDNWRFKNSMGLFNLAYGIRVSHWDWNKETLISPRASLGLMPSFSDNWVFRVATGVYYQAPFYKELRDTAMLNGIASVSLNKDIKAQRSIHFVIGGDYTFRLMNRPFKFTTEAYYKALSNLIPYNVDNLRIIYYGRNMSKGYAAGLDFKLFGEFVPGTDSWITFSIMSTKEKINGKTVPRPTDQRYNLSLYFTDYFPGSTRWRVTLKAALAAGLPFGAPRTGLEGKSFRAPAYKRVDVGMSYRLLNNEDRHIHSGIGKYMKNVWLGVDAFNLLGISNVNSYYWVTDITNTQYAVPNYLTGRRINARFVIEF